MHNPTRNTRLAFMTVLLGVLILLTAFVGHAGVPDQAARWDSAKVRHENQSSIDKSLWLYGRIHGRYEAITALRSNGAPAIVLFCLHQRESDGSFARHPHEGSPLMHRTRDVPKGRLPSPNPPYSWEQSAEDAYYVCDHLDLVPWHKLPAALQAIEAFNGTGYQRYHPDVPSPYLWAGTTVYLRGKYVEDGRFDRFAVDKQVGAAAILKRAAERGIALPWDP